MKVKKNAKIKLLQQKCRRLEKKVESLEEVLVNARERNILSQAAVDQLYAVRWIYTLWLQRQVITQRWNNLIILIIFTFFRRLEKTKNLYENCYLTEKAKVTVKQSNVLLLHCIIIRLELTNMSGNVLVTDFLLHVRWSPGIPRWMVTLVWHQKLLLFSRTKLKKPIAMAKGYWWT